MVDPLEGAVNNKHQAVEKRHGLESVFLDFPPVRWVDYKPKSDMLVLGDIYPEGFQIPEMFFGKNVLHLPTMKTHVFTTITGAMKNAFGGLLNRKRHWTHSVIHETLVDLLRIQKEIHFASRGQKLIYWGPLKPLENFLLRSPIAPWSFTASNVYHNSYWMRFIGRKRVREAMKTGWGRLFQSY